MGNEGEEKGVEEVKRSRSERMKEEPPPGEHDFDVSADLNNGFMNV